MQFVIINLDRPRPPAQESLVSDYFHGYIPHIVVLDKDGKPKYSKAGEVPDDKIAALLDDLLKSSP